MQPHLKKCFDNIKSLRIQKMGITQKFEGQAMYSADGECVDFGNQVVLEGPVEVIHHRVEMLRFAGCTKGG